MKGQAALLLVLLGLLVNPTIQAISSASKWEATKEIRARISSETSKRHANITTESPLPTTRMIDTSDVVLQDIKSMDDSANNEKIQEELARVIKEQARKTKPLTPVRNIARPSFQTLLNISQAKNLGTILKHADATYNYDNADDDDDEDDDDEDETDSDDDDYDEDEEEDDDEDEEEDEDDDDDDDDNDDEEVTLDCPIYCRCTEQIQYLVASTTAKCSQFVDDQVFGSNIGHLKIEDANDIRLGPSHLKRLGLHKLESITIVNTKIIELDRTAFDGLNDLFVVNLTRNNLKHVAPDTFQRNSQLSFLTISENPLRQTFAEYLLDAPSVAHLDLSGNQLFTLPRKAFSKMPNLSYINLKRNRLRSVEREFFSNLNHIMEVDLSHNLLQDLPHDLFKDKNILSLNLAGNTLTTLGCINAPSLNTLDASMNQLKSIAAEDLSGVPSLQHLLLNSNKLRRINQHALSRLEFLTWLDLSNNNLMQLGSQHLKNNSRLQVLLLNDNPDLETLPIFRTSAQEYERYSIARFECENCGLSFIEPGTFDAMPAMTQLNLARNQLSGLPRGLLKELSSLRDLDLSMNRIDKLDDYIFEGATSLTKLSLAMNSFVNGLQISWFLKTPNLARLDLSYCGLQKIWNKTTVPFESLRFLSLHKNRLNHVKVEELEAMPKLTGLDISRNPLKCNDQLKSAIDWLSKHDVTPTESFHAVTTPVGKVHQPYDDYSETVNHWTDLADRLCAKWDGGPPTRPSPRKPNKKVTTKMDDHTISLPGPFFKTDKPRGYPKNEIDRGQEDTSEIDKAWSNQEEYEDLSGVVDEIRYRQWWYGEAIWPAVTIVLMIFGALLITAQVAICLAKRRGQGPVIRRPLILRPGIIDNKNCGLVYKPLQEEIPTTHQTNKRGSFYSSSTFHYNKIVPESV